MKKLIIFIIIFALGFVAGKHCCKKSHKDFRGDFPRAEFVNGCLNVEKIDCPMMAEKVAIADANNDGCITKEEYRATKKEFFGDCKCEEGKPCRCGKAGRGERRGEYRGEEPRRGEYRAERRGECDGCTRKPGMDN